ncbi:MAG TPA: MFS transporter, partial [Leptospiraceae bacterium]|nr:MFS transporter [Leptospiraceae bacterium]
CLSLSFFSRTGEKPVPESDRKESMFESIGAGFSFVMKNEIVLGAMSLDMFAVLFGGAVAVLPIFASDILRVGPDGLGMLRAAPAVGAALMAVFLAYHPPKKNAGRALLFAVAGFGVTIVLFGISQNFLLSIFFLGLSGAFDCISVVLRSTIMQTFTPDEMRGRVSSVNSIFIGSSNELGAFESGVAAKFLGTVTSVIFGGCMTIAIAAGVALRSPVLRRLDFTRSETVSK